MPTRRPNSTECAKQPIASSLSAVAEIPPTGRRVHHEDPRPTEVAMTKRRRNSPALSVWSYQRISADIFRLRGEGLDVVRICVSFGLAEVLLDFALDLLSAPLDVLAGIVGGVTEVAANLALHFLASSLDLVLETFFVQIFHQSSLSSQVLSPRPRLVMARPQLHKCKRHTRPVSVFYSRVSALQRVSRLRKFRGDKLFSR